MVVPRLIGSPLLSSSLVLLTISPVWAQSVTPEAGSPTQVTQSDSSFTITGGVASPNGQNLFHSFQDFGLSAGQVATFLTQPQVQALFGRVVGGNASVIDGLLRVSGSSADLYLINPAGILFGPHGRLDLSGSFTATTASGIQFDDALYNAVGSNDYSQLVGSPTGFLFTAENPGAIANQGILAVNPGEAIALISGQVLNTGVITAPGGDITIAAIPGENWVRISQANSVLSLELAALPAGTGQTGLPFAPLSLPELLTGGAVPAATGLTVNPDGTLVLSGGATVANVAGTAIASGSLNVSGNSGGNITVVGDRVGVLNGTIRADGNANGGTIRIGGDYQGEDTLPGSQITVVDADSTLTANAGTVGNGGRMILWSDGTTAFYGDIATRGGASAGDGGFVEVSGAATLIFRGTVDAAAPHGVVGILLLDPENITIRNGTADGDDSDADPLDLSETDIAVGDAIPTVIYESELEGTAGNTNLTIRASNRITLEDLADNELTFQAGTGSIRFIAGGAFTVQDISDAIVGSQRSLTIQAATITTGTLDTSTPNLGEAGGDVRLVATGAVSTGDILTSGDAFGGGSGNVTLSGSDVRTGLIRSGGAFLNSSQVALTATSGDVIVDAISAGSGGININAARQFQARDTFDVSVNIEFDSSTDAALIDFLMKGNAQPLYDAGLVDSGVTVAFFIPTSLLTSPDNGPGNIVIRHGGVGSFSGGNITIQGSGAYPTIGFVAGPQPDHTIVLNPAIPDVDFLDFLPLYPPGTFPGNLSGTVGAILRGQGDATLVTSFQNQVFLPAPIDTTSLEQLGDEEAAIATDSVNEDEATLVDDRATPDCTAQITTSEPDRVEIDSTCELPEDAE